MILARRLVSLLVVLLVAGSSAAPAQIPKLKKLKDVAKKVIKSADTTKARTDSAPAAAAAPGEVARSEPAGGPAAKASPKVWENYDFVPGNKVIFFTDFSEDKVGNFARGLKYKGGSLEVVERDGVKMLRSTSRSEVLIPVGKRLPERFTLEIDIIASSTGLNEPLVIEGGPVLDRGPQSAAISWGPYSAWILGSGMNAANSPVKFPEEVTARIADTVAHIRVLMDSAYFKMYVNERRIYNIPELAFRRDSVIRVFMTGSEEEGKAVYLTSIRVAESETDVLYDALAAKGRWSTQGILFATGKAELQPESRPVLKEIAGTLAKHADLTILIEGHTDNVGGAAANLALSDARAAAVKAALVEGFGVDAGRIATKGFGDTVPAAPNTTAVGRAQNRRVEVVKQ